MTSLPIPTVRAHDAVVCCAATVANAEVRSRYLSLADNLLSEETDYTFKGHAGLLHTIQASDLDASIVSKEEMIWLYDNKFSKDGQDARRDFYDKIRGAGLCPLCEQQIVRTLDHFLAKSIYPVFAITPVNLIPACSDCNKLKIAKAYFAAEELPLNPYFDDINDAVWLSGMVITGQPVAVIFSATPPAIWPETKQKRVKSHFSTLELDRVYTANAGVELSQLAPRLSELAIDAGADAVRQELENIAAYRSSVSVNSWQAATYRALAESEWFWQGGHRSLPLPRNV